MVATKEPGAQRYLPERRTLGALRKAAAQCRGCTLYRDATQTVFGEGRRGAPLMLVGEQPGDHEDREGHPLVGPAGRMLDRALHDAGIDPTLVYATNAVKHQPWPVRHYLGAAGFTGRGELLSLPGLAGSTGRPRVLATVHPSAVLRYRSDQRSEAYSAFVDDLSVAVTP